MKNNKVFTTDWLNSSPVFYNTQTKKISHSINEVVNFKNIEFDPEGLKNYLEFGYSVFGHTPVKDVHFIDHSSTITKKNNEIIIQQKRDIAASLVSSQCIDEEDVFEQIIDAVQTWEAKQDQEIIIPTSGGFDSRLLNFAIKDKTRIASFTYGLSDNQSDSYEVVYARELARILKTNWQQITLGGFHSRIDRWNNLFGPSTHSHGMYQMEFYEKIRTIQGGEGQPVLSGIVGDAWAEKNKVSEINSFQDLNKLGYTHGLHADPTACLLKSKPLMKEVFYNEKKEQLSDERLRTVEVIRMKMMLLRYLFEVPIMYGFSPWSPFLEPNIVLNILRILPERRKNRQWQRDFFKKAGLLFEEAHLPKNNFNTLNEYALTVHPLPPLSAKLLCTIINKEYVAWINDTLSSASITNKLIQYLLNKRVFNVVLPLVGITSAQKKAYSAYLTLKPLQYLLEKQA